MPVVAAAVGGLRTLVDHGAPGFLVDARDPADYADAIDAHPRRPGARRPVRRRRRRHGRRLPVVHHRRPPPPPLRRPLGPDPRQLLLRLDSKAELEEGAEEAAP